MQSEEEGEGKGGKVLRDLHTLLLETQVMEGKLVCGNCGHEYAIKEGIANFLLPSHLGEWAGNIPFFWLRGHFGARRES